MSVKIAITAASCFATGVSNNDDFFNVARNLQAIQTLTRFFLLVLLMLKESIFTCIMSMYRGKQILLAEDSSKIFEAFVEKGFGSKFAGGFPENVSLFPQIDPFENPFCQAQSKFQLKVD